MCVNSLISDGSHGQFKSTRNKFLQPLLLDILIFLTPVVGEFQFLILFVKLVDVLIILQMNGTKTPLVGVFERVTSSLVMLLHDIARGCFML